MVAGLKNDCSSDAATSELLMRSLSLPMLRYAGCPYTDHFQTETNKSIDGVQIHQMGTALCRAKESNNRCRLWFFDRKFAGKYLYQNALRSHTTGRCVIGTIFVCLYGLYEERDDGNKSSLSLAVRCQNHWTQAAPGDKFPTGTEIRNNLTGLTSHAPRI